LPTLGNGKDLKKKTYTIFGGLKRAIVHKEIEKSHEFTFKSQELTP
jgi:hypothetical protein